MYESEVSVGEKQDGSPVEGPSPNAVDLRRVRVSEKRDGLRERAANLVGEGEEAVVEEDGHGRDEDDFVGVEEGDIVGGGVEANGVRERHGLEAEGQSTRTALSLSCIIDLLAGLE